MFFINRPDLSVINGHGACADDRRAVLTGVEVQADALRLSLKRGKCYRLQRSDLLDQVIYDLMLVNRVVELHPTHDASLVTGIDGAGSNNRTLANYDPTDANDTRCSLLALTTAAHVDD